MSPKIREALLFLKENYDMTTMSQSSDNKWFNLCSYAGPGCILEERDENVTFTMCFSLPYGEFKYMTMSTNHLGSASDIAYQRVLKIYQSIEMEYPE